MATTKVSAVGITFPNATIQTTKAVDGPPGPAGPPGPTGPTGARGLCYYSCSGYAPCP